MRLFPEPSVAALLDNTTIFSHRVFFVLHHSCFSLCVLLLTDMNLFRKKRMLGCHGSMMRSFQCGMPHTHDMTKQMLSYLRFAVATDRELANMRQIPFNAFRLEPISAENEKRAMFRLYQVWCSAA